MRLGQELLLSITTLPWCSEGSLNLWAFQDSAKVCIEHLVHWKAERKNKKMLIIDAQFFISHVID